MVKFFSSFELGMTTRDFELMCAFYWFSDLKKLHQDDNCFLHTVFKKKKFAFDLVPWEFELFSVLRGRFMCMWIFFAHKKNIHLLGIRKMLRKCVMKMLWAIKKRETVFSCVSVKCLKAINSRTLGLRYYMSQDCFMYWSVPLCTFQFLLVF